MEYLSLALDIYAGFVLILLIPIPILIIIAIINRLWN